MEVVYNNKMFSMQLHVITNNALILLFNRYNGMKNKKRDTHNLKWAQNMGVDIITIFNL